MVNLTISRAQHERVPWLAWLKERKSKNGSQVEVVEEVRLAEDRA